MKATIYFIGFCMLLAAGSAAEAGCARADEPTASTGGVTFICCERDGTRAVGGAGDADRDTFPVDGADCDLCPLCSDAVMATVAAIPGHLHLIERRSPPELLVIASEHALQLVKPPQL